MDSQRVVVVTGGSMGIGKEIARAFSENGDRVIICARTSKALQQTAKEIQQSDGQVIPMICDVADEASVKNLVTKMTEQFGRIDVLVNNAGIYGPIGLSFENDSDKWLETLQINLFGVFLVNKYVIPVMIKQGGGSIINLSGGGATGPKPRYSAYAVSKAGVVRLTDVLAAELADYNIRVNAIAPGFIATRFHKETLAAGEKGDPDFKKVQQKLEQGGDDPRKAAELAVFLTSDEASHVTGRLISAIWDDWRNLSKNGEFAETDLFTLRRIDNVFYKEVPKE